MKNESDDHARHVNGAGTGARRLSEDYVTRADLYAEARKRGIEGRSKMTKAELRELLSKG